MMWLYVFLGGGLGSVLRFAISRALLNIKLQQVFPIATLCANLLASLILALLLFRFQDKLSANALFFWVAGFCGGFSTFSTFSLENWQLYKHAQYWALAANVGLSLALSFILIALMAKNLNLS
jgi:CrcB protein